MIDSYRPVNAALHSLIDIMKLRIGSNKPHMYVLLVLDSTVLELVLFSVILLP
jgi:hypothetical protein